MMKRKASNHHDGRLLQTKLRIDNRRRRLWLRLFTTNSYCALIVTNDGVKIILQIFYNKNKEYLVQMFLLRNSLRLETYVSLSFICFRCIDYMRSCVTTTLVKKKKKTTKEFVTLQRQLSSNMTRVDVRSIMEAFSILN